MRWVSAFSGIEGFALGFEQAGLPHPLAQIEVDKHCQALLRKHWPDIPLMGDIAHVRATNLPDHDALIAGVPCTDTSIGAPHRLGIAGERSGNFWHVVRLLVELAEQGRAPRWLVIENPDGLLRSPGRGRDGVDRTGWDMAAITSALAHCGYVGAWRVVDGSVLGSAQRRRRVLLVAVRGADPGPAWEVLGDSGSGGEAVRARAERRGASGPAPVVGDPGSDQATLIWRKSARPTKSLAKGGYETWVPAQFANTLVGYDGGLPTRQTHLLVQDDRLRTFTLSEWELLMGFPVGWTADMPDSARYTALGNAMMVPMAAWLGRRMAAAHQPA